MRTIMGAGKPWSVDTPTLGAWLAGASRERRRRDTSGESPAAGDAGELIRRCNVDAVGSMEEPEPPPGCAGVPVLPDDAVAARVDDDHAVVCVVIGEDVSVRER